MAKKFVKEAQPESLEDMLGGKDSFVVRNQKNLLYGAVAIVVVVMGIVGYFQLYRNPRIQDANNAIYPSQNLFASQQWEKALNGDSTGSAGFLKVADQYSGTDAANLANAYAAVCYYNLGKVDEAIACAEKYDANDDSSVSPAVVGALGNLYVAKGDKEKGVELLVKAASSANDQSLRPVYLLQAGQIYEDLKNNDKALECYQQIKDNCKQSQLYQEVDKYIERINAAK